jgi:hypothetical protein
MESESCSHGSAQLFHSWSKKKCALPDPERVSLNEAARVCGVSHGTIERLVEAGLLKCEQTAPPAPWEIRRADLSAEPVSGELLFRQAQGI